MNEPQAWANRLEQLGFAVRDHLTQIMTRSDTDLISPVVQEGGDTIFAIDRHVENLIIREIDAWPSDCKPLLLIAEGFGDDGRHAFGPASRTSCYRLIVDPIDGSRGLMYDKRSAWFLAAIAHDVGEHTRLADTFAAVAVELPTTKQLWCDSYVATAGRPPTGRRSTLDRKASAQLPIQRSTATTLKFGFGQVSSFFPGTKVLAADLMERIASATVGQPSPGQALIFDDQYISTGGQMVELIAGHDRFCCDLRPLFYEIAERRYGQVMRGLECHPYDMAGMLVAKQAGVVIVDGFGVPFDCPLDVQSGIHWCGYANQMIADLVQPVITGWLKEHGITSRR